MKTSFFFNRNLFVSICLAIFFLNLSTVSAQFEETIAPTTTQYEEAVDGKQIPMTSHFMMLSNTHEYGQDVIALTELDACAAGSIVQRTIVWMPGSTNKYHARSLEVVLTAAGAAAGYWITGYEINGAGDKRLVLIQTNLGGFPICVRYLENRVGGAVAYDEEGVSLERQPNGDIIVIGHSVQRVAAPAIPIHRMIAARFPAACNPPIWSFRYNQPANTHLIPEESCNGVRITGNPPVTTLVVAVTGKTIGTSGTVRTFASNINAATGVEFWRRVYNSGGIKDEGLDIVQDPAAPRKYMIVGRSTNAGGITALWVLNVASNSGALTANTAALYTATGGGSISGTDVCLSTVGNRAVIAGRVDIPNTAGTFNNRAFMARLPFTNCANLEWFKYYVASTPVATGSESVVPVTAPCATAPPGYFMTTGGLPTNSGWIANGAHPVYTDVLGDHGLIDCPTPNWQYSKVCVGTSVTMAKTKTVAPWIQGQMGWEILQSVIAACDGILPAPKPAGNDRDQFASNFNQNSTLNIYPNPTTAGQVLNLNFTSTTDGEANLMMFDLTGKMVFEKTKQVENGRLSTEIETNELAPGAYFLKLRTAEGIKTAKILVE